MKIREVRAQSNYQAVCGYCGQGGPVLPTEYSAIAAAAERRWRFYGDVALCPDCVRRIARDFRIRPVPTDDLADVQQLAEERDARRSDRCR